MKTLVVTGRFDSHGGKPSGYASKLFVRRRGICEYDFGSHIDHINGGTLEKLNALEKESISYNTIIWFAEVSNSEEKIVHNIKKNNPQCILVTSKNNIENKYDILEIIDRALKIKSNLFVIFTKERDLICSSICDPLGNEFNRSSNIKDVRLSLSNRIWELSEFTRIESCKIGEKIDIPNEDDFLKIARKHTEELHIHSHGQVKETARFLGNLSFRCNHGFPSFKKDNLIFVSKRNIDKRKIDMDGFVAVQPFLINEHDENAVKYFGDNKPSVDTPIQILLYEFYSNIRYMFHSHAYIAGANYTANIIPCGAIEEAGEIQRIQPNRESNNFSVNLRGHGSLILASDLQYISDVKFTPRILPEKTY